MAIHDRIHDLRDGRTIQTLSVPHLLIGDVTRQNRLIATETAIVIVSVVTAQLSTLHVDLVLEAIPNHRFLANVLKDEKTMGIYRNPKVDGRRMTRRMTKNPR